MSGPEDNPRDDEPFDKDEYEGWEKEHAKERRADEDAQCICPSVEVSGGLTLPMARDPHCPVHGVH